MQYKLRNIIPSELCNRKSLQCVLYARNYSTYIVKNNIYIYIYIYIYTCHTRTKGATPHHKTRPRISIKKNSTTSPGSMEQNAEIFKFIYCWHLNFVWPCFEMLCYIKSDSCTVLRSANIYSRFALLYQQSNANYQTVTVLSKCQMWPRLSLCIINGLNYINIYVCIYIYTIIIYAQYFAVLCCICMTDIFSVRVQVMYSVPGGRGIACLTKASDVIP